MIARMRKREITSQYNALTGGAVLSAAEARAMVDALIAVGPPKVPAGATPSAAMTPEGIIEAGEVARGEKHNGRAPPQPQRHQATAAEIDAATKKARGEA